MYQHQYLKEAIILPRTITDPFELFEFIIHVRVSHYAKFNPNQYGFTRTKSTVTNLVTFLDFLTPVLHGQSQKQTLWPLVRRRNIPTELLPLFGEI
jgi:hypothetical protein